MINNVLFQEIFQILLDLWFHLFYLFYFVVVNLYHKLPWRITAHALMQNEVNYHGNKIKNQSKQAILIQDMLLDLT